jgi:hypothetical protein
MSLWLKAIRYAGENRHPDYFRFKCKTGWIPASAGMTEQE